MLPKLAAAAHVAPVDLSSVIAAGGLGGLAGAMLCPALPLSVLLPGGLISLGLAYSAVPLAGSVPALSLIFASASVCAQGVAVGGHAQLAREGGAHVTTKLNAINAFFGAGSLAAPLVHDTLGGFMSGATSYWPVSALLLASSVPFLVAQRAEGVHTPEPQTLPAPRAPSRGGALMDAIGGSEGAALTVAVLALVACNVGAEVSYASWLYTHATSGMGMPSFAAASVVSTFWGALTAGRLLAAAAASRGVQPASILRATLPLAVVGPAIALSWPGSASALTLGVGLGGVGLSSGFANSVAFLARHVRPSGTTQSLIQLAACGGALLFAPIAGVLAQPAHSQMGTSSCLFVAGACAAVDVACLLVAQALAARMGPLKQH